MNRFEKARIIGARALQLSLGAPPFIEISAGMINPVDIAFLEAEKGVIPLSVKRSS
jgi:DNA-directed RNA polymerase subunit K/omega